MDVRYRDDRTVDFLNREGSDKPGVVVSSTEQTIVEELTVEDNSRDPVTHVRGLGAQQGTEQVEASAVVSSYSSGDRQVWRKYTNKDIVQADRMQEIVDRLAAEYSSERRRLRVEAKLVDVDVGLGDRVQVTLPSHDIDRMLRITEFTEVLDSSQQYVVTLTNRDVERGGDRKRRDDLQRFNAGDQGFVDRDTDAYGWQPVTASVNARRPYPYPDDVVAEQVAEVTIDSIPYRAYSQGAASGGGVATTTAENTEQSQVVSSQSDQQNQSIETFWQTISTYSTTALTAESYVPYGFKMTSDEITQVYVRVYDSAAGEYYPGPNGNVHYLTAAQSGSAFAADGQSGMIAVPGDASDKNLELQVKADTSISMNIVSYLIGRSVHEHNIDLPSHTHDPQPGLIEFSGETASGVDLIVNGTVVATDVGSGQFSETVDVSGYLTAGENTIEASSDSLGLVNLTVQTQLFRSGESLL